MHSSPGSEVDLQNALIEPGHILHFHEDKHFSNPKNHYFLVLNKFTGGSRDTIYLATATSEVQKIKRLYIKSSSYSYSEAAALIVELPPGTACFTKSTIIDCGTIYDYSYDELKNKLASIPTPISVEAKLNDGDFRRVLRGVLAGKTAAMGWLKTIASDNGMTYP